MIESFNVLTFLLEMTVMKSQVVDARVARCDLLWEMRDISRVCSADLASDDERRDKERRSRGLHSLRALLG